MGGGVALILLGGCASTPMTSQPSDSRAPQSQSSAGGTLDIKNFTFSPMPLAVKAGQTVTVTNDDTTIHTVRADDTSFDTGNLNGGTSGSFVAPAKAGTYAFHCNIHDFMTGTIQVAG